MHKVLLLFVILLWAGNCFAQTIEASFTSMAGTKGQIPTWLWANQLGRYDQYSSANQNFEFLTFHKLPLNQSDFSIEAQVRLNFLIAEKNELRFTELFGGINWKFLQLKLGAFAEKENYSGLSASNGNLAYSRNARPHPRLRLGFSHFAPLISNWFSFYGFWEEGLLKDERYVNDTHLHHKAFYFRIGTPSTFEFTWGLEHYVMWWGIHPKYGELPGWEDYFKYVSGSAGGENSLPTDQANVLGNGYGTYQLELKKDWKKLNTSLYISHPFEDRSGMELDNWRDNIYGLFFSFHKEKAFIKGLVLEYYYTKHQSGSFHLKPQADGTFSGRGMDNYFNHGVYHSGVTYHQKGMGSSIFAPLILDDGVSLGFENNRISGIHLGANGYICQQVQWKTMFTQTSNFGRYHTGGATSYTPSRKQLATLFQLDWQLPKKPILIGTSIAADHCSLLDEGQTKTRVGVMLSLIWQIQE